MTLVRSFIVSSSCCEVECSWPEAVCNNLFDPYTQALFLMAYVFTSFNYCWSFMGVSLLNFWHNEFYLTPTAYYIPCGLLLDIVLPCFEDFWSSKGSFAICFSPLCCGFGQAWVEGGSWNYCSESLGCCRSSWYWYSSSIAAESVWSWAAYILGKKWCSSDLIFIPPAAVRLNILGLRQ